MAGPSLGDLIFCTAGGTIEDRDPVLAFVSLPGPATRANELRALVGGLAAIGLLTVVYAEWLRVTNPTIVALSFLFVVLIVATMATRRIAITASLLAFLCFNYFFLPPLRTWTVADPQNWVALLTLLGVSIVASHLSQQIRQQAEAAKEAEVIRRSAELKSALLASFSHDLKTPLTALTVAANSLNATWLTEDQRREQAEIVRHELDRLNRLFEDIVEMARIDSHAVAAEVEWVPPAEIVEAAIRRIEPALENHRIEADTDTNGALVRLDPRLTSVALAHVMENAAQYSPAGSTIKVTVRVDSDELMIAVRDEGPGIPPEDVDRLFDRYYRGDTARRQRFGTGMGLSITRGLLAAEGGRVWAENDAVGAVFTLAVPVESRTDLNVDDEAV